MAMQHMWLFLSRITDKGAGHSHREQVKLLPHKTQSFSLKANYILYGTTALEEL